MRKRSYTKSHTRNYLYEIFCSHILRAVALSALLCVLLFTDGLMQASAGAAVNLFLSFGFIVVAAWLYRWPTVFYAAPGIVLYTALADSSALLQPDALALGAITAAIFAPFSFGMMRWAGISVEPDFTNQTRVWKVMLLGGVKTSVFAFIARAVVQTFTGIVPLVEKQVGILNNFPMTFTTEMLGLMTFMFGTLLVLKFTR